MKSSIVSEPSIKINQLKGNIRLMAELKKIDSATADKIIKELRLDILIDEWNRVPVWKRMMKDLIAFMETYDIKVHFRSFTEATFFWNNMIDRIYFRELPAYMDVDFVKTFPKKYAQYKALDREFKRKGKQMTAIEATQKLFNAEGLRFPGAERIGSPELEKVIEGLYLDAAETEDSNDKEYFLQVARWLEELTYLRKRLMARQTFIKGKMNVFQQLEDFRDWLESEHADKTISFDELLEKKKDFGYEYDGFDRIYLGTIENNLINYGWTIKHD